MNTRSDEPKLVKGAEAIRNAEREQRELKPSWRDTIKVHPFASIAPLMESDELQKLADDIAANDIQFDILTCNCGKDHTRYLIDGRNRLDASELLGRQLVDAKGNWYGSITKHVKYLGTLTEKEVRAIVETVNFRRKHYTPDQLKAAHQKLVPQLEKQLEQQAKVEKPESNLQMQIPSKQPKLQGERCTLHRKAVEEVANMTGVHPVTVYRNLKPENAAKKASKPEAHFREVAGQIRKLITKAVQHTGWTYRNRAKACERAGRLLKKLEQEFTSKAKADTE